MKNGAFSNGVKRQDQSKIISSTALKNSLVQLWKNLSATVSGAVIMYDDLHYLASSYPQGLYDLRGVFQELREFNCRYMLVVTGSLELFSTIRGISEPVMRFFEQKELEPFTPDEVNEAIHLPLEKKKIPLKYEGSVIRTIHENTKGHPYFVTFLAHDIFEYKSSGRITISYFNEIYQRIFAHLSAARFIKDLSIASDKEKEILFRLGRSAVVGINDLTDISNAGVHLKRLIGKGLVVRVGRGRYTLYHPLFQEYLRTVDPVN